MKDKEKIDLFEKKVELLEDVLMNKMDDFFNIFGTDEMHIYRKLILKRMFRL